MSEIEIIEITSPSDTSQSDPTTSSLLTEQSPPEPAVGSCGDTPNNFETTSSDEENLPAITLEDCVCPICLDYYIDVSRIVESL